VEHIITTNGAGIDFTEYDNRGESITPSRDQLAKSNRFTLMRLYDKFIGLSQRLFAWNVIWTHGDTWLDIRLSHRD
jgi:hypothetical protein